MRILGSGLIARSFAPYADELPNVVAFARGVADSSTTDEAEFARERHSLERVLQEASSRSETLVYFSGGGAVYGDWSRPASETYPSEPGSPYGRHQMACEAIIDQSGVPYLIVRLPNVVGPTANRRQLVPNLVGQAVAGRVHVERYSQRDLLDGNDMAAVVSELLRHAAPNQVVNVASGHAVPVSDIVHEICQILGVTAVMQVSEIGTPQRFDTTLLRHLLGRDPFPRQDYYRVVLRKSVPALARETTNARV